MSIFINRITSIKANAFGGGGSQSPAPVQPYIPPPAAQSPQAQDAGKTAAARATATSGAGLALAGMSAMGLQDQAKTTNKKVLGE